MAILASASISLTKVDDGRGIKSVTDQYYLSTSNTTQTGGSWSSTMPEWEDGKYIWTRSYVVWSDGTESTTDPVLAGALNSANENASDAVASVNKVSAELAVLEGEITARVESVESDMEGVQTTVSNLEVTTEGIKTDVTKVTETAEDALSKAENAQDAADNAQDAADEAKSAVTQLADSIKLIVVGPDGSTAEIAMADDGTITLTGDVIAQKIFTELLMAQDITATGSFQVDNGVWKIVQSDAGVSMGLGLSEGDIYYSYLRLRQAVAALVARTSIDLTSEEINLNGTVNFADPDAVREDIGAAPAGYNDEGYMVFADSSEFDAYLVELVAAMDNRTTTHFAAHFDSNELSTGVPIVGNTYGVTVCKLHESNYGYVWIETHYNGIGIRARNIMLAGELQGWEWEHPLLALGVEYRTTERYMGKVVYAKLVNFGTLPNASSATVPITGDGVAYPVRASLLLGGTATAKGTTTGIPTSIISEFNTATDKIYIRTDSDKSSIYAKVEVYYTKS